MTVLLDQFQRPLRNLRLSVTDRCNLRCSYCMPEPDYVWLPRADILQFEEIERLVDLFLDLGVEKLRLTGGEPLLRRDLPVLVERLAARSRIRDLAMTTNGVLLSAHARSLADAGLHRLTVSLDTLQPERFRQLTRTGDFQRVLDGIAAAAPLFPGLKVDTVVIRGTNDDELVDLIEFGRRHGAEVRFHRIYGRGRRHALVDGPRCLANGHAGEPCAALRPNRAGSGGLFGASRSLSLTGRHGLRDHLVDD